MADKAKVPHVDVSVASDNYVQDFPAVLKEIRTHWKTEELVYKEFPKDIDHGLVNTMVRCYRNGFPEDSIMVRVMLVDPSIAEFVDRIVEPTVIKHLGEHDCAPKMLATFRTGFCYEYIHGEILSHRRLAEQRIWRAIAVEFAKLHSTEIECPPNLEKGTITIKKWMDVCWATYPEKLEDSIKNERFQKEFPSRETLEKELNEAFEHALTFDPDLVMCHNDTRAQNIVWNERTGVAKFVDFESIGFNYRAVEIATHFLRWAGVGKTDFTLIPKEEVQLQWLRVYLEKYFSLTGRHVDDVTDLDVRRLYVQVNKFLLVLTALGALGGIAMETLPFFKTVPLNGLQLAIDSIQQFYKDKDRLLAMKMPE